MKAITENWKTTLAGIFVILDGALKTFLGVDVPGSLDFASALPIGLGLIVARDAAAFNKPK